MTETSDRWLQWLQEGRSGGDPKLKALQAAMLAPVRQRVLDQAHVKAGDVLLDVGCGDGLIAFAALDLVGERGHVVFSDISKPALDHCLTAAEAMAVVDRCSFVEAPADTLAGIADDSIDVVTTRSVLIYVDDKPAAFRAFARVLRPGGRISLFEPINSFERVPGRDLLWGIDVSEMSPLGERVRAVFRRRVPEDSPLVNFDERDLVAAAQAAGFWSVTLQLEAQATSRLVQPPDADAFDALIRAAPNPLAPSLSDAMDEVLTPAERDALLSHMRRRFAAGDVLRRRASAYLQAIL